MRDLTRGPILGHIGAMSLPIAIGMTVQTLYYLVDLYFVSRLGGTAIAGVGAAGNVAFLVTGLLQMLSVGTVALVSQAVGRDDRPNANLAFNQAVFLATVMAVATLVGAYFGLTDSYVTVIAADAPTALAGMTYLKWFMPAMALQFLITSMGAALQGTGIVKPTMVVQLLTVLVNCLLTPVLVAGWLTGRPMGVAGAGLSTSLSAGLGLLLMTVYFVRLERYVSLDLKRVTPRLGVLKRMLAIGLPAGGEFILMFVYMAVIYRVVGGLGASAQAGFGVGMRVMQAVFLPALAIAFAIPAIVGQNYGAKNASRIRETFRSTAWIVSGFMALLTLFCQWKPEWLVYSFSSDIEVWNVAAVFITIVSWNFVSSGLSFTCSGMFQGMGNTLPALASTATRLLTFVPAAFWVARQPNFRIEHVWYLSVATVTLQALLSLVLLRWQMSRRLNFAALDSP